MSVTVYNRICMHTIKEKPNNFTFILSTYINIYAESCTASCMQRELNFKTFH